MKIANSMAINHKLSGFIVNPLIAIVCVIALLVSGCQSSQSSSSSSSTAMPSPSTSSPSTPVPSPSPQMPSPSSSQSSSSSSSTSQGEPQQQKSSSSQEPGGSETAYEEEASKSSGGEPGYGEDFPSQGAPSESLPGDVLSQEEAVAVLDGQFDESIAVFDGMIIGERAAAQAAQDEFPDDDSLFDDEGFDDDSPLFEEADINEDSDSPGSPTDGQEGDGGLYSDGGGDGTAGETASSRAGSRSGGVKTNMPGGPVPSDIPDGSDDDIVARQIREAAMKEQDPVLREKLWDEYRKYKKGQ